MYIEEIKVELMLASKGVVLLIATGGDYRAVQAVCCLSNEAKHYSQARQTIAGAGRTAGVSPSRAGKPEKGVLHGFSLHYVRLINQKGPSQRATSCIG